LRRVASPSKMILAFFTSGEEGQDDAVLVEHDVEPGRRVPGRHRHHDRQDYQGCNGACPNS
jgi:hypothetical protein